MKIEVLRGGFLTTVQDLGRRGYRSLGVSLGGALDEHALRIANLLVGNEEDAAGLEITLGAPRLRFEDERLVAWCGGDFEGELPAGRALRVCAGDEITFPPPRAGCRSWLAVSGGVDVPAVLGSRATDLRARFGGFDGRALRDGDALPLATSTRRLSLQGVSSRSAPREWVLTARQEPTLRVLRGADWERFEPSAQFALTTMHFDVSNDSNRMGARLEGPKLTRMDSVELRSEPVVPGTIQVPPSGQPIILLGDCQTIGGYPKIAHVISVDLPIAAQLRPGDSVRFREVSLAAARDLYRARERDLARFRVGVQLHWQ